LEEDFGVDGRQDSWLPNLPHTYHRASTLKSKLIGYKNDSERKIRNEIDSLHINYNNINNNHASISPAVSNFK